MPRQVRLRPRENLVLIATRRGVDHIDPMGAELKASSELLFHPGMHEAPSGLTLQQSRQSILTVPHGIVDGSSLVLAEPVRPPLLGSVGNGFLEHVPHLVPSGNVRGRLAAWQMPTLTVTQFHLPVA